MDRLDRWLASAAFIGGNREGVIRDRVVVLAELDRRQVDAATGGGNRGWGGVEDRFTWGYSGTWTVLADGRVSAAI